MLCPRHCHLALEALDEEWTTEVARDWEKHEGAVEMWKCRVCGSTWRSEMVKGVRRIATPVEVRGEVELPA